MRNQIIEVIKNFVSSNNEWVSVDDINLNSSLIELGIDSIQIMMLIVSIEDELSITLEDDILENHIFYDIETLVNCIEENVDESNLDKK